MAVNVLRDHINVKDIKTLKQFNIISIYTRKAKNFALISNTISVFGYSTALKGKSIAAQAWTGPEG